MPGLPCRLTSFYTHSKDKIDKNRIGWLAFGLLCESLLAGCAHKDSLAGTATNPRGATINTTLVLTEDGKDNVSAQSTGPTGSTQIAGSGTYAVSGDTLTLTDQRGSMQTLTRQKS